MKKRIFHVDAFTERAFGGNPAAVVVDAEGLIEREMQLIAREVNLSETAFVVSAQNKEYDYHIRFFTPTQEVDLCGHATIAAFCVLSREKYIPPVSGKIIIKQKTKAGMLPVELYFRDKKLDFVMMTQATPNFSYPDVDPEKLCHVMNIPKAHMGLEDFALVPEVVSTGLPDIIMPVKGLEILKAIQPDYNKLANYSNKIGVTGVHVFTMETENINAHIACRNFAPAAGINEESATGTSNGSLGAYLIKNNLMELDENSTLICEQGIYMGRPSKIFVKIEGTKDNMIVKVGGKAVVVIEGIIEL